MRKENRKDIIEKVEKEIDSRRYAAALKLLASAGGKKLTFEEKLLKAEALRFCGRFSEAAVIYARLTKFPLEGEKKARVLIGAAASHRALGDFTSAFPPARKAVAFSKKTGIMEFDALLEYAMVMRMGGRFAEAERIFSDLLAGARREKDSQAEAFIYWALGGIYRLKGLYRKSESAFRKSASLAAKCSDGEMRGYALFGLGGVLRVAGKMDEALKAYRLSRKIFSRSGDDFARAYSECGLANVLRQKGELEKALEGYRKALGLYSGIRDVPDLAFVEWGIGEIYKRKGKLRRALSYFLKAGRHFADSREDRGKILTMISEAQTRYLLGETGKADSLFDLAYRTAKKKGLHTYLEVFT